MALAIDASTPAAVSSGSSVASLTTASFTPPTGSLLTLIFGTGGGATGLVAPTNTGGTVSWAAAAAVSEVANTCAGVVWLGTVTVSASMTVTCHPSASLAQWGFGVAVVTGQAATQNGATKVTTSASSALPSATITSLVGSNSLVVAGIGNEANGTIGTPGTGQSITFNSHAFSYNSGGGGSGWGQYLTGMNLSAGSSATINDTAPSVKNSVAMLEILAAAAGGPTGPYFVPSRMPLGA